MWLNVNKIHECKISIAHIIRNKSEHSFACFFFFSLITFQTSQCDSRGVVGWESVDALGAYLVGLNRTITALSGKEEADIVHLYTALHDMDKAPSRYKIVIIMYTIIIHTFHETNEAYGCLFHCLGTARRLERRHKCQQDHGEHPGSRVALLLDSRRQKGA